VEVTALLVVDCARAEARMAAREKMEAFIVAVCVGLKMFNDCAIARGKHSLSVLKF
jgi:hypothetical protein